MLGKSQTSSPMSLSPVQIITWNAGAAAEYKNRGCTCLGSNPAYMNSGHFSRLACFFIAESIKRMDNAPRLKRWGSVSEVEKGRVHKDAVIATKQKNHQDKYKSWGFDKTIKAFVFVEYN